VSQITPKLVKDHGLSESEYQKILGLMGREPTLV
jgi:phosphoribosylformylglycinamidine synthase